MCKLLCVFAFFAVGFVPSFSQARNVPPWASCTSQVNQNLQDLLNSGTRKDVDNIMVCGDAVGKTRLQSGGPHGNHHVTTLSVNLPDGRNIRVQVVSNDDLDGLIMANAGDHVAAYGQGYKTHGQAQAGVHDVHCSTHPGADSGWVYINGQAATPACN